MAAVGTRPRRRNPFNATWGTVDYVSESFAVSYQAPGATSAAYAYAQIFETFPPPSGTPTVVPTISPVTAATVAGQPLTASQAGVGVTPTIAWSAPSIGTPTAYHVVLLQLVASGGATTISPLTLIVTTAGPLLACLPHLVPHVRVVGQVGAAHALSLGWTLATHSTRELRRVPGPAGAASASRFSGDGEGPS